MLPVGGRPSMLSTVWYEELMTGTLSSRAYIMTLCYDRSMRLVEYSLHTADALIGIRRPKTGRPETTSRQRDARLGASSSFPPVSAAHSFLTHHREFLTYSIGALKITPNHFIGDHDHDHGPPVVRSALAHAHENFLGPALPWINNLAGVGARERNGV